MSEGEIRKVFDTVQGLAAKSTLPLSSWYIITAATLLTADGPQHYGPLYTHTLMTIPDGTTISGASALSTIFREIIIKSWTLVGMPRAIAGSYSLQRVAVPEDLQTKFSRKDGLLLDPVGALDAAESWFKRAFAEEEGRIWAGFGAHMDMEWTLKRIVYGIFLADLMVLNPIENELVVLACVMGQGSGSPTWTHLAALKRIGVSEEDAGVVIKIVKQVAEALGKDTSGWVV